MMPQKFESKDVDFNPDEIQLKRNNFIYATFNYSNVSEIKIYKGYLLKNRYLVIVGSLLLISFGISVLNTGHSMLYGKELSAFDWIAQLLNRGAIVTIWGPIIGVFLGALAIYSACIKSDIAILKTDNQTYKLRIKEIEIRRETEVLYEFLKTKKVKIYKEST